MHCVVYLSAPQFFLSQINKAKVLKYNCIFKQLHLCEDWLLYHVYTSNAFWFRYFHWHIFAYHPHWYEGTQAPSTCIRIFLNPHLFLSGLKNFPVHTLRIQIKFACPHASDGIQIHSRETRPTHCAAILVYCSVRDWTRFCYVIRFENIQIHRPHIIEFVAHLFCFHSGERIQKHLDSLPNSPDACGWKPYPERKRCGFKNIWIRVDGASVFRSLHSGHSGQYC